MDNLPKTFWGRVGLTILFALLVSLFGGVAVVGAGNNDADDADAGQMDGIAGQYRTNQPLPAVSGKSQLRGNLIDILKFQIEGGTSWTYFFNAGMEAPVWTCPSIGDPIPITHQLTNPNKGKGKGSDGITTLNQMEPTGVFTGDSDGTNVICLGSNGQGYKVYWEGQVFSSTIELQWDPTQHMLVPKPNGKTSEHQFNTRVGGR